MASAQGAGARARSRAAQGSVQRRRKEGILFIKACFLGAEMFKLVVGLLFAPMRQTLPLSFAAIGFAGLSALQEPLRRPLPMKRFLALRLLVPRARVAPR